MTGIWKKDKPTSSKQTSVVRIPVIRMVTTRTPGSQVTRTPADEYIALEFEPSGPLLRSIRAFMYDPDAREWKTLTGFARDGDKDYHGKVGIRMGAVAARSPEKEGVPLTIFYYPNTRKCKTSTRVRDTRRLAAVRPIANDLVTRLRTASTTA